MLPAVAPLQAAQRPLVARPRGARRYVGRRDSGRCLPSGWCEVLSSDADAALGSSEKETLFWLRLLKAELEEGDGPWPTLWEERGSLTLDVHTGETRLGGSPTPSQPVS